MKIKVNSVNRKNFSQLCNGEVFMFDETIYMKIEKIFAENDVELNAVDLEDGATYYFGTESVVPLKNAFLTTE